MLPLVLALAVLLGLALGGGLVLAGWALGARSASRRPGPVQSVPPPARPASVRRPDQDQDSRRGDPQGVAHDPNPPTPPYPAGLD